MQEGAIAAQPSKKIADKFMSVYGEDVVIEVRCEVETQKRPQSPDSLHQNRRCLHLISQCASLRPALIPAQNSSQTEMTWLTLIWTRRG